MTNAYVTSKLVLTQTSYEPLSLEDTVQYLVQVVWQQEDRIRKLEHKPTMQEEFELDVPSD